MTSFYRFNILLITGIFLLSGCASTGTPPSRCGYQSRDIKEVYLKGMSDKEVISLFSEIYNQPVESPEDITAKDITIAAFIKAMESMNSQKIEDSGVLRSKYKKINFKKWTDDDLVNMYQAINIRIAEEKQAKLSEEEKQKSAYWAVSTPKKGEAPKDTEEKLDSLEVIRFTALYAIGSEISRRDIAEGKWNFFSSAVGATTAMAVQVAMVLGAFLI